MIFHAPLLSPPPAPFGAYFVHDDISFIGSISPIYSFPQSFQLQAFHQASEIHLKKAGSKLHEAIASN